MSDNNFNSFAEPIGNGPRPGSAEMPHLSPLPVLAKAETPLERILNSIDAITNDSDHIKDAIEAFKNKGDTSHSLGSIIAAREKTNQQALDLLKEMYNDLKPTDPRRDFLKGVNFHDMAAHVDSDDLPDFVLRILGISE